MTVSRKLLVTALCAAGIAGGASARVKYIAHGWDLLAMTPEEVLAHADAFDRSGVDGVTLMIREKLADGRQIAHSGIMNDPPWPREQLKGRIAVFREIVKHPSLKESFISSWWQPNRKRLAWTDDAAWANFAANMGTVAWLAKEGGLRGVLVDGEDYPRARQYDRLAGDPPYDEAAKLARKRGAEVFGAIFREYPDVTFLSFWLLSITPEYFISQDPVGLARARNDLWPSFLNGMLDVIPPEAKFVDGNEHAYRYDAEKRDFFVSACRQRKNGLALIAPENRAKYRAQLRAGFGLYLDAYVQATNSPWYLPPLNGSRLARFGVNLGQATDAADEYIWLYGERHPWVALKKEAMKSQRFVGKPTWNDVLPGFTRTLESTKDRLGYIDRCFGPGTTAKNLAPNGGCRAPKGTEGAPGYFAGKLPATYGAWQEEKARQGTFGTDTSCGEGDSSCLCAEGVQKGCFLLHIPDVKPGEHYAVLASGRGDRLSGTVYWQKKGRWQWQLTGYGLAFADGGAEVWRRGRALVEVPEGADRLVLQLGAGVGAGERVRYDNVAIYRVD